jgi:hypothetical protein
VLRLRLGVPSLWWLHQRGLSLWCLVLAAVRQAIDLETLGPQLVLWPWVQLQELLVQPA